MKFHGMIGFIRNVETSIGIIDEISEERLYTGDFIKMGRRIEPSSDGVNDGIRINIKISFVGDPYSMENYFSIKYVVINKVKWKVTDVDVSSSPRIVISLGGVYNG